MSRQPIGTRPPPSRRFPMCIKTSIEDWAHNEAKLSTIQLRNLSNHKYSASSSSILDSLVMHRFWDWLVLQYPLWLAPNLITMVGLVCNMTACLILSYYSPDGKTAAPWWSYFLCAVMLFFYQALDATDGKQARRTNTASPMGELFDHGCDSLSQIFVSLEICLSIRYGHHPYLMLCVCMYAVTLFYMAHWQTYVCGTLKFGKFDVTEAQFSVMFVCCLSAFFGPQFWDQHVFGFELKQVLMAVSAPATVVAVYNYLYTIFMEGAGKHGSTVADTSVLSPLVPLILVVISPLIIYSKSSTGALEQHLVLYCITFGLVAAKITNRLIIAHMSKNELPVLDVILFVPGLLVANQYFDTLVNEYYLLIFCCILAAVLLFVNSYLVCVQISEHMKIDIFHIPYEERREK